MKTKLYERGPSCTLHLRGGSFRAIVYRNKITYKEHVALISDKTDIHKRVLIRIHSSCLFGDVFGNKGCDCYDQLSLSIKEIGGDGGVLFYLNQEGRDIGLWNKVHAYALKERGFDTVEANEIQGLPADNREFSMVTEMLDDLGIRKVFLLTNNPEKLKAIKKAGVSVKRKECKTEKNGFNKKYIETKEKKMGHL